MILRSAWWRAPIDYVYLHSAQLHVRILHYVLDDHVPILRASVHMLNLSPVTSAQSLIRDNMISFSFFAHKNICTLELNRPKRKHIILLNDFMLGTLLHFQTEMPFYCLNITFFSEK